MKSIRTLFAPFFIAMVAMPGFASSNWLTDFLNRPIDPKASLPKTEASSGLSQLLQTGTLPVSISDIVQMIVDNNLDIRTDRLAPRSSYLQSLVFYRALQPALRFSGTVSRNTTLSNSQLNGTIPVISQLRGIYDVNFSQLLPTGTSVGVDAAMTRTSSSSNLNTFNPSYIGALSYTVGQHLLRDRGRLVNTRQILQGQNSEKISEAQFEIQMTNLLVQAAKSYWDLVFAGEDLDVKQRSLELAKQTLEENKLKVDIGTLAPVDLLQTRTDIASRQELVVVSQYNVTAAEDQIKKMISADKDPAMFLIRIHAQESPLQPDAVDVPGLAEAITIALENRPEMRQAALTLKNNNIDVEFTKNQTLPTFDVTAGYTQNGTGGTQIIRNSLAGTANKVVPGGVGDAFGQIFGFNYSGYSAGFSVTIPLNNKAAKADYERALNDRRLSQSKLDATAQQIALDVRNALTQVEMNRARIDTGNATLELARQQLEAEQEKFDLGTSTLRFVLEEQRNVAQAESNELQNVVNFTKSVVDLDRAMGMSLRKNNIDLDRALGGSPTAR
jgi:outer membrane protein TolC